MSKKQSKKQQQQPQQVAKEVRDDEARSPFCPICLEDFDLENNNWTSVDDCGHIFCLDCLESHCESCILVQKIPIPCPRHCEDPPCPVYLTDDQVKKSLLGPSAQTADDERGEQATQTQQQLQFRSSSGSGGVGDRLTPAPAINSSTIPSNNTNVILWRRYLRSSQRLTDPSLISCPKCEELVAPNKASASKQKNNNNSNNNSNLLTCPSCTHIFCQVHGDLHPISMSCSDYEQTNEAQQIQASEDTLSQYTKPCSNCGSRIFKASGCDHVVCPACGNDMCFKCGTHVYLTGKVIRTCHKCRQGYLDHRYDRQHKCRMALCLPFLIPFYVVYILVMVAACAASCLFCACCGCSAHLETDPPERRTPGRAIQLGFYAIVLPILFTMHDFGFHMDYLDHMGGQGAAAREDPKAPEIPALRTMDEEEEEEQNNQQQQQQQQQRQQQQQGKGYQTLKTNSY